MLQCMSKTYVEMPFTPTLRMPLSRHLMVSCMIVSSHYVLKGVRMTEGLSKVGDNVVKGDPFPAEGHKRD